MTLKTGNFKKFSIFVEMLESALTGQSSTVTVDVLTLQDLQNTKAAVQDQDSKVYLIITYTVAFDRFGWV